MTADVIALTAQGHLRGARDGPALRFLGIPSRNPRPPRAVSGRLRRRAAGTGSGTRSATARHTAAGSRSHAIPEPIIAGDNS